jgi:hypothetical protein
MAKKLQFHPDTLIKVKSPSYSIGISYRLQAAAFIIPIARSVMRYTAAISGMSGGTNREDFLHRSQEVIQCLQNHNRLYYRE